MDIPLSMPLCLYMEQTFEQGFKALDLRLSLTLNGVLQLAPLP